MWTYVDFSVCVVAPPESEAWGQAVGSGAEGVGVSVEGSEWLFAREHRAGFPPRLCGRHRFAPVIVGEGGMLMLCAGGMPPWCDRDSP